MSLRTSSAGLRPCASEPARPGGRTPRPSVKGSGWARRVIGVRRAWPGTAPNRGNRSDRSAVRVKYAVPGIRHEGREVHTGQLPGDDRQYTQWPREQNGGWLGGLGRANHQIGYMSPRISKKIDERGLDKQSPSTLSQHRLRFQWLWWALEVGQGARHANGPWVGFFFGLRPLARDE